MAIRFARLGRPYDWRTLIEVYIHAKQERSIPAPLRQTYYTDLLEALERLFEVRLSEEAILFDKQPLWRLVDSTIVSLFRITSPWDGYLEGTPITRALMANAEAAEAMRRATQKIGEANVASEYAHRDLIHALFKAIFGEPRRVVTSEELARAGFDDSRELEIIDHYADL